MLRYLNIRLCFCGILMVVELVNAGGGAKPQTALPSPKEVECVSSQVRDFGFVYQGQKVKHTFKIRNLTNDYIPIETVKTSCGCTAVLTSYQGIEGKASTDIEITVDTQGKPERPFSAPIVVVFGGEIGTMKLDITGTVIIPNPDRIDFGKIYRGGKNIGRAFYLKTLPGERLKVMGLHYNKKNLNVKVSAPNFWNRHEYHRVTIESPTKLPDGAFEELVTIKTNRSYQPEAVVVLTGRIVGQIEASPASISLGIMRGRESISRRVKLDSPYRRSFGITAIENPFPEYLSIEHGRQNVGLNQVLSINLKKEFPPGKISGIIKVGTTIGEDVNIPVYGIQREIATSQ